MKKLILFILLCICATISEAQEADLTGTWIGTYKFKHLDDDGTWYCADYKLYVRIYKYEEYRLKMKDVPIGPSNRGRTTYYDNCTITSVDDHSICFYEKSEMYYQWEKGIITEMWQLENHYRLLYSNGVLHISPVKRIMIEYDEHGNFLKREDITNISGWVFGDIDLYKEETDW